MACIAFDVPVKYILARRAPPDPREGFNPSSTSKNPTATARSSCRLLRIRANRMENRSWITIFLRVPSRPSPASGQGFAERPCNEASRMPWRPFDNTFRRRRRMTPEQVLEFNFRLADAQSAIARATGFASWPQLSRHVDQLRALEGTWEFASLVVDGQTMPAAGAGLVATAHRRRPLPYRIAGSDLRGRLQYQRRSRAARNRHRIRRRARGGELELTGSFVWTAISSSSVST